MQQLASRYGILFDPWQSELGMFMLGKRASGLYAAGVSGVVLSFPRQVGKTYLIGMTVIMLCILHPRLKVVWTAHRTRTSGETFRSMRSLAQSPGLQALIPVARSANGQEELTFSNGSRILFGAREQGFGRGFDKVNIIIFDEAQILTNKALEDMLPTMNAATNPIAFYMGTPPRPVDPGEAFTDKRTALLSGLDSDGLYCEFSAPRDADLDDRAAWQQANPSYPTRTSEIALLRLYRQLSTDSFRREVLGVWDTKPVTSTAISKQTWDKTAIRERVDGGLIAFGVDVPPSRDRITLSACMRYEDNTAHVEHIVSRPISDGVQWLTDYLSQRRNTMLGVGIDTGSAASTLIQDLTEQRIPLVALRTRDVGQACGRVQDMLTAGTLYHLPEDQQPALAFAALNVTARPLGRTGLFAWSSPGDDIDITPLVAATYALHAATISKRHPGRKQRLLV